MPRKLNPMVCLAAGSTALLFLYYTYFFMLNKPSGTSVLPYNGTNITFELANGDVMVNLTEMAKAFGKRPNDFLGLPSTNQLVKAITRKSGISENQVVIQKQGAPQFGGGTWANRLVALSFAQWLSVDFHLICLEKIEELLTQGVATIANDDEAILHAIQVLQKRVEANKQRIQMLEKIREKFCRFKNIAYICTVTSSESDFISSQIVEGYFCIVASADRYLV